MIGTISDEEEMRLRDSQGDKSKIINWFETLIAKIIYLFVMVFVWISINLDREKED